MFVTSIQQELLLAAFLFISISCLALHACLTRSKKSFELTALHQNKGNYSVTTESITEEDDGSLNKTRPSQLLDQNYTNFVKRNPISNQKEDKNIVSPTQPANSTITTGENNFNRKTKWQCACEGGIFLPSSILKSFSGAEAVFKMGSGQCYHKNL
jgi:hypothetical protein